MSSHARDISASVRARLLAIAKRENRDFNLILNLYYQERLLARLAASRYQKLFLLKGGLLLFALSLGYGRLLGRPTKDVDLRAEGIANDPEKLRATLAEVCYLDLRDGLVFAPDGITVERIAEDAEYQGVRLRIPVSLAGAQGRVQVDIGFGDVVTPGPLEMVFPALLEDMAGPVLLAYSLETVVAEKYQIMINLSATNSRMKDFFDLYSLAGSQPFSGRLLQQAIINTFRRRDTPFLHEPTIFRASFGADSGRQRQWIAFLRQSRLVNAPERFESVAATLNDFLRPLHSACADGGSFVGQWSPETLRWL